ncbi:MULTISPECIES: hypothetical protein [unclassified Streptomyces]|uniref:hypothetical protein n=1 Tax=unclassified Streptomyces TaxID=2593676 RepID=UPI002E2BF5FF|nr:hypothetical protein [Streptomyces sp. NBC_01423]WSX91573.1 hypothetical protein OH827_13970 [Streptomyces sp. NBC_00891]WSY06051.1 hypothetical protein OG464_13970 [Streptomyces sp. NBC_00890]WSZ07675.1 hypothetical protein OG704_13970 [Streptomyces sp. NBC_00869]WSZ24826.1 hypothetical protein OG498_19595 [Streptomyces sp. NBC_00870]
MAFNPEQFQAIIDKLNAGLETISKFVTDIGPKVESAVNHWFIPDGVAQACVWIINKVIKAVNWVIAKLVDIMMGAYAPAIVFYNSVTWQGEEIRGKASGVASSTQKFNLTAPKYWEGEGATAYTNAVFPQSAASAQVASSAGTVSGCLAACGVAGCAFYAAVAIFVAQLIPVLAASTAAVTTVVGIPAAGAAAAAEATLGPAVIGGAAVALLSIIGAEATTFSELTGESTDKSAFPNGGHWPVGTV